MHRRDQIGPIRAELAKESFRNRGGRKKTCTICRFTFIATDNVGMILKQHGAEPTKDRRRDIHARDRPMRQNLTLKPSDAE